MPCTDASGPGPLSPNRLWRNWAGTSVFRVPLTSRPTTRNELVNLVDLVERTGGFLKAAGTGWSYSDAAVDRDVTHLVATDGLARVFFAGRPIDGETALPDALTDAASGRAGRLVHVEAGITVYDLNCVLDAEGLALPTLGGSNGQSIAGAISTATHGGDVNLPPIADSVRAIHLVGPGGLEWWIERSGDNAVTDRARMEALRGTGPWCADLQLEYDDEIFAAALVSLGRMGIIYSVVLEAVPAFRLCEQTVESSWSVWRPRIRDEIIDNDGDYTRSRFLEIVLNPYRNGNGDHDCSVTERWEEDPDRDCPEATEGGTDLFELFCQAEELRPVIIGLQAALPPLIAAATAAAVAAVGWIPFIGPLLVPAAVAAATATLLTLELALIRLLAAPRGDLGALLVEVANLAVGIGQTGFIREMTDILMGAIRPARDAHLDDSFKIMTGQEGCTGDRPDDPACMRIVDGLEFAFDATPGRTNLLDFIDDVFQLTEEFFAAGRPAGFGLSLRFTRGSEGLLAMQQFRRTAHVEFLMLRGVRSHDAFVSRLYRVAERHGGLPHWGLIHDLNGSQVAALYGDNHRRWRIVLGRMIRRARETTTARRNTFSTTFSIRRDLEPLFGCVVPRPLIDLLVRALMRLSRGRTIRGLQRG